MIRFNRTDMSLLARWSRELDWWFLIYILALIAAGMWLTLTASPAVAERLGLESYYFAKRQIIFLALGIVTVVGTSFLNVVTIRRMAIILLPVFLLLLALTLLVGPEYKGSTRWLQFSGFTIQPSEFLKPLFIVVTAWLLSSDLKDKHLPAKHISTALWLIVVLFLLSQPDYGQTLLISAVWLGQMALAGLPFIWIGTAAAVGLSGLFVAYLFVPHISSRINGFLFPENNDTYQTDKALDAFANGGMFGQGPGEGMVKMTLPDAHTDYIFAVAGEEFGAIACLVIIGLFTVIVVRGLMRQLEEEDPFIMLAVSGLLMQFGLQAVINMGVNLALLPSKGMTLPFISYGGSSMLALALGIGMVLALTRKKQVAYNERSIIFGEHV
jgi:cell division protein FtsW